MNRYLIFGSLFFVVVFGIFLMLPSSSPVEKVEDVKYIFDKKEERSLHKASSSAVIEYESTLSSSSSSSSVSSSLNSLSFEEKSEIKVIEKLTGEKNLEPLYKEWKQKGELSYNVYIKPSESGESDQKLLPPAMPSFTTIEVSGEKISVVMPSGAKGYVVTKEGGKIKYQPIESNMESMAPPGIDY